MTVETEPNVAEDLLDERAAHDDHETEGEIVPGCSLCDLLLEQRSERYWTNRWNDQ